MGAPPTPGSADDDAAGTGAWCFSGVAQPASRTAAAPTSAVRRRSDRDPRDDDAGTGAEGAAGTVGGVGAGTVGRARRERDGTRPR
ncbi:hypothetical protein CAE01nite_26940 [Cellulomonas aerilata]|uniref:Uncharacterized protein n=1 Tax=Cellulomonas aerilata TaxID=515326 RepID=A0A512DER7_9CELL|nr:hypothetical protein CAE01nite_26940 [Cellulomonas aerilata]